MKKQITLVRRALSLTTALTMVLSMSLMASARDSEQGRDHLVIGHEAIAATYAEDVEIAHAAAIQAARDAAITARGTDRSAVVRFTNPGVIRLKTLRDMNAAAGNTNVSIWADNYLDGANSVDVRVYINPAKVNGDIDLSGSTISERATNTADLFTTYFGNNVAVVSLGQQDDFNHIVNVAAKLDLRNMDTSNLHFYAYDRAQNSYRTIRSANQYIDAHGYLCFTTPYGGDIVVSNKSIGNASTTNTGTTGNTTAATGTAMTDSATQSQALLKDINAKRAALSKTELVYDSSLESAANAYAQALSNGGRTFRLNTDYSTLPSGNAVHTLFTNASKSTNIHNFDYIVFQDNSASGSTALANHIAMLKGTGLYQAKAVQGDFTKIGITCSTVTEAGNAFTVVIMIFYNDTSA